MSFSNKNTRKFARIWNNSALFCKELFKNLSFFLKIDNKIIFIKKAEYKGFFYCLKMFSVVTSNSLD